MSQIIRAETNEQCYFDFDMQLYGMREIESGELFKVYYSGLSMGLPFAYESKESAEIELSKYNAPYRHQFTVDVFTDTELIDFMNELNQRYANI